MNAFAVRIWPLLLIVALIAVNAVGGSPLHIKNKNGNDGNRLGNRSNGEEDHEQNRTGITRMMQQGAHGVYSGFRPDCFNKFFVGRVENHLALPRFVRKPPEGLPTNGNTRYICQNIDGDTYYATMFDEHWGIPVYSAYTLSRENIDFQARRNSYKWKQNEGITAGRQGSDEVYPSIPFHRGHLVPKQTYSSTEKSTKSTYTYTNAVPQRPFLNSGMWSRYEEKIRWYGEKCTHSGGVLYLLTGIAYFFIHDDGRIRAVAQEPGYLKPVDNPSHGGIVIPNSLWTAGCCVSDTGVGNFAVVGNNLQRKEEGGITLELKVSQLEHLLHLDRRLTDGQHVNLFPAKDECRADNKYVVLPTEQPDFGLLN